MEPRSVERGMSFYGCRYGDGARASMEPRSVERVMRRCRFCLGNRACASMEPRSVERGMFFFGLFRVPEVRSFNGAAFG